MRRTIRKAAPKQAQCTCEPGNACALCKATQEDRQRAAEAARRPDPDESPLHSPIDWGSMDPADIRWVTPEHADPDPRPRSQCGLDESGTSLDYDDAWSATPDFAPLDDGD